MISSLVRSVSYLLQCTRPPMCKLGHARRRPNRRAHEALADALDEAARTLLPRAAVWLAHQPDRPLQQPIAEASRALQQHPAATLRLRTGRRRHLHRRKRAIRRAVERAGHLPCLAGRNCGHKSKRE